MKRTRYLSIALFKPDQLELVKNLDGGFKADGRGLGYLQAWHRTNLADNPHSVANEYICAELGRFLRLPIPRFSITHIAEANGTRPLFSSLDFNYHRAKLPPIEPSECIKHLPKICTGILVFDVFIANDDRHDENLVADSVIAPKELQVFDHDQALFGGVVTKGVERLEKVRDSLGICRQAGGEEVKHVFMDYLTKSEHFDYWLLRVDAIPDWFIRDICTEARELGLSADEAKSANDFLMFRKRYLPSLIHKHRNELAVTDWERPGELPLV